MKNRILFAISSLLLLHSVMSQSCLAQTPLLPGISGTYYYEGYDSGGNRHAFISSTGTWYYVDTGNVTTTGGTATLPVTTPYRAVVAATSANYQFHNTHPDLYTVTTSTNGGVVTTATSYAARSGTWFASDATFTLATTDASAIWAAGYTGSGTLAESHPVAFIGTNVNAITESTLAASRQAVSVRNGGDVYMFGGTVAKTVLPDATGTNFATDSSEAIYLVGNQEGHSSSSHFYGEDLTIIANGPNIDAISMGNGNNTFTLKDSSITSITTKGNTSQAILLNDTQDLGSNHFHGENLLITNNSGRIFAFGIGDHTITLVSSTVANSGTGAAFGWNATAATTYRSFAAGSSVTLKNTSISTTANYSPIFQMIGDKGSATVTGGTLFTAGIGSPILRLVAQSDASGHTRFVGAFQNAVLDAQKSSAIDINIETANSANYGQAGGGKHLTTPISDAFDILFQSSTVTGGIAALRLATAGSHDSPYGGKTNVYAYDSTLAGGIKMVAGGGVNETSGANFTFTASNSQLSDGLTITGTEAALFSNQAIFHVYDSAFDGDITLTNRGQLVLHFTNTPIDGALSLSGSTQAELRLANSPINGAITVADTAVLFGEMLGAGNIGLLAAAGAASVTLRIGGDTAIPGGIHLAGNAILGITLQDSTRFAGDITILDRATFALATAGGAPLTLDDSLNLSGIWRISGKTTLSGDLALTATDATITIVTAGPDSLTLTNGLVGNGRLDALSIDGTVLDASEIRVIHDPTGMFISATNAPLVLAQPVDYGLVVYVLENRPDGAYLVEIETARARQFKTEVESPGTTTVTVNGALNLSSLGRVTVASGKTIVGADADALIMGDFSIPATSCDIVICGVTFNMGALHINGATDVDISHCTFFSTDIAITDGADNIAFSWNKFIATAPSGWMFGDGSAMTISGAGTSTGILLHHNLWGDGLKTDMPNVTNARAYMYNNYFSATGNITATIAGAGAQILSVRNIYQGVNNPITKHGSGLLRTLNNFMTATTGTTAPGEDKVFVPAYPHIIHSAGDTLPLDATAVATLITAHAGNTGGKNSITPPATNATASISATVTGSGAALTQTGACVPVGGSFMLTAKTTGFTPLAHQWYRHNFAIAGATSASYAITNATTNNDNGAYSVALATPAGEIVATAAFDISVGEYLRAGTLSPSTTQYVGAKSGTLTFIVAGVSGVSWTSIMTAGSDWARVTGDTSGVLLGDIPHPGLAAAITVAYDANPSSSAQRTATLSVDVAGLTYAVPIVQAANTDGDSSGNGGNGGGGAPSLLWLVTVCMLLGLRRARQPGAAQP